MPRSMWKGAISFGLVTIPVSLYPATEEKTLQFNQLHDEDHGRISIKRMCAIDGEEVTFEHIVKGYEYEKDKYVVLTDDDFDAVPVESSRRSTSSSSSTSRRSTRSCTRRPTSPLLPLFFPVLWFSCVLLD